MTFVKGKSGNPSGKPKEFAGIQELARSFAPAMVRILNKIARDKKAAAAARATAAGMLLDRAYGKPPAFSTTSVGEFRRAVELSDDELIRIAAEAGLKLEPPVPKPVAQDTPPPAPHENTSTGGKVH
jgi:hypothetical protein